MSPERPPESVLDFVQGITVVAWSKPRQDVRLVMEGKAKCCWKRSHWLVVLGVGLQRAASL